VNAPEELLSFARESLGLPLGEEIHLLPLGKRGSDRSYYRITWGAEASAILAHYQSSRIENTYYAAIAQFLLEIGIHVPRVIGHNQTAGLLLQEDLGEIDLWTLREAPGKTRRALYRKTLAMIHTLHSYPARKFPADRVMLMESFSPDLYRWERDYFKTNFVINLCKINLDKKSEEALEKELSQLAEKLLNYPSSLVHRDLQSQNIMIRNDGPYLIDFQGMRFGNLFYDLGSLLCDPYVSFTNKDRLELLNFYFELSAKDFDRDLLMGMFWEASAQRLMQALGAYGFLGMVRGLKEYLRHIPAGLGNLRRAAESARSLPQLLETCHRCEEALIAPGWDL
jgi:N-acetylmuramate 1-kinase